MLVQDAKFSIYFGLKALPWPGPYLTAMWIVCGELRPLYADWIRENEIPLMDSTMDLVRDVAMTGDPAPAGKRAAKLASAWGRALKRRRKEHGLPGGVLNALAAFEGLAQEIAGISGRYDGANWATNAAADRWETWEQPGPISVRRDEEADDASPMAQTLSLFQRIVTQVSHLETPGQDPAEIRARILGQPGVT
jgi:hypothetical protein